MNIIATIFYTELLLLFRRSQQWLYPLCFFVIVICLFPFAFAPDPDFLQKYLPGCIWIAALLASLLSIQTIFLTEIEEGSLEQWLLSTTPLTFLLCAKLSAQWVMTTLPLLLLMPLLAYLLQLSGYVIVVLEISLLFGTIIFTLIGSLGVALTIGLRQQGTLLGVLMLPLVMPIFILGVTIAEYAQANLSIAAPLAFLAGVMMLMITILPVMIAAVLRVNEW